MDIFKRQPKKELPPLFSELEIYGATYEQVIDFLTAVNDKDYFKIIKVAETTRLHNAGVAKITGMKPEPVPSIFDRQTAPPIIASGKVDGDEPNFLLDDDDELMAAFEGSEPDLPDPEAKKLKPKS